MDRFQMNRSGCRPYQYTCGMNGGMAARNDRSFSDMANHGNQNGNHCNSMKKNMPKETCGCKMPGTGNRADQEMYSHLKHLVPAMAYVPCQEFAPTFELKRRFRLEQSFLSFASRSVAGEEAVDDVRKLYFKKELLQSIDQVSFAIDDLLLFLDTHPREKELLSITAN